MNFHFITILEMSIIWCDSKKYILEVIRLFLFVTWNFATLHFTLCSLADQHPPQHFAAQISTSEDSTVTLWLSVTTPIN